MASLSSAWSSTLGVVTKSASTITNTVDTVDVGVSMLNDFAHNARREQKLRYVITEDDRLANLELEIAQARTERMLQIEQWTSKNDRAAALFNDNLSTVRKSIEAAKASL